MNENKAEKEQEEQESNLTLFLLQQDLYVYSVPA